MWQRVQTLYLAIATALIAAMLFIAKAVIPGAEGAEDRIIRFTVYIPYLILIIVAGILDILALTTWKHIVFQRRTAVLAALITLALQAWLAVDFFTADPTVVFRVPAVFPVVAAIFDFLAARAILADEMLVRSASRLRSAKRRR